MSAILAHPFARRADRARPARPLIVAMDPPWSQRNRFITLFRAAVESTGARVVPFSWTWRSLFACDVVVLHWPRTFFDAAVPRRRAVKALLKLLVLRWIGRGRLVWVVHNLDHHEAGGSAMARPFVRLVDGFLFLSQASVALFDARHSPSPAAVGVVSAHGCYEGLTRPRAWSRPAEDGLRLLHFGLVRAYKNLDTLMLRLQDWSPADVRLTIVGARIDRAVADRIDDAGRTRPDLLTVDLRDDPLDEAELEGIIDAHHAVILPYREILNSGSAMLALSRHRPVIAPAIGAMPELRDAVGADWVHLYDGALSTGTLRRAAAWVRDTERTAPDLGGHGWDRVARDLGLLFDQVAPPRPGPAAAGRRPGSRRAVSAGRLA